MQLQATRGPLVLAALSAAPVVMWAGSTPLHERFTGSFAALTSVAVACALAGTSAFALNLVLGARLRLVAALFGGLEPMYRAHRANGRLAFALLLAHVVLILAARATVSTDAALSLLRPGAGWTVFAGVLAFGAMTVAIVLTLFVRLGHEVFVYVQRSFGFAFLGATYHVFTTSGAKADSRLLNAYLATLATLGLAAFAYRSLLGSVLVRRRRYRVQAVDRLDESVTEIVMRPVGRTLAFAPGQFVFVNFRSLALRERFRPFELSAQGVLSIRTGEVSNQFHPFSITSAPGEPALRLTVKAVGDYTRALRELEAGAEAIVEGPYGSFSHRDVPERRQVWIAGGIGVTPFLSMARSLGDRDEPSVDFYYCVERREEAHFLDELHEVGRRRPDFRVTLVPRDTAGFLTADRLAAETGDLSSRAALICGPPAMIESLRGQLLARGMHRTRIHAEEFGFARLGRSAADAGADVPPAATSSRLRPRRRPPDVAAAVFTLVALAFAGFTFAIGVVVGAQASSHAAAAAGTAAARTTTGGAPPAADGRDVFASAGCGECHTFAAAGSTGSVGPNLDDADPKVERVRELVLNGSGTMPPYRSRLDDRQIDAVAAFVSRAAAR